MKVNNSYKLCRIALAAMKLDFLVLKHKLLLLVLLVLVLLC